MSWFLFYLVVVPIVYQGFLFGYSYTYCDDVPFVKIGYQKAYHIGMAILNLLANYIIEFIYVKKMNELIGTSILTKGHESLFGEIGFFIFCQLAFIFFHIMCLFLFEVERVFPISNLIALAIFFSLFLAIQTSGIQNEMDERTFNNMEYELEITETELYHLADSSSTSGTIHGRRYYISGNISTSYIIRYATKTEDGSIAIREIPYSEDSVKIFEEENCTRPRVITYKYYKGYNDLYHEYYTYEVYIPTNTFNAVGLDME